MEGWSLPSSVFGHGAMRAAAHPSGTATLQKSVLLGYEPRLQGSLQPAQLVLAFVSRFQVATERFDAEVDQSPISSHLSCLVINKLGGHTRLDTSSLVLRWSAGLPCSSLYLKSRAGHTKTLTSYSPPRHRPGSLPKQRQRGSWTRRRRPLVSKRAKLPNGGLFS